MRLLTLQHRQLSQQLAMSIRCTQLVASIMLLLLLNDCNLSPTNKSQTNHIHSLNGSRLHIKTQTNTDQLIKTRELPSKKSIKLQFKCNQNKD